MNLQNYLINEKEGTLMPHLKHAEKALVAAEKAVKKSLDISDRMEDNIVSQAEINMMRKIDTIARRITYHLK